MTLLTLHRFLTCITSHRQFRGFWVALPLSLAFSFRVWGLVNWEYNVLVQV